MNNKTIWLDVETTGFDSKFEKIIEIAIILEEEGKDDVYFHKYIKHKEYGKNYEKAEKIHGISKELLEEKGIDEKVAYDLIIKFLDSRLDKYNKEDKYIIAGYNVGFDDSFLSSLFKRYENYYYGSYFCGKLDVLSVTTEERKVGRIKTENLKLSTIKEYYNIISKDHSAIEDIKATKQIYYLIRGKEYVKN